MKNGGVIHYSVYPSPLGPVFAAADERGLTDIMIRGDEGVFFKRLQKMRSPEVVVKEMGRFSGLFRELDRYFRGERVDFRAIGTDPQGTAFEKRVWKALTLIPWGSTVSYGWVALKAGCPQGARSVGGACGKNPLPIVIPCHRVLSSDGSIGGYTGGIGIKRALLKTEGVVL